MCQYNILLPDALRASDLKTSPAENAIFARFQGAILAKSNQSKGSGCMIPAIYSVLHSEPRALPGLRVVSTEPDTYYMIYSDESELDGSASVYL